jgi:uncharacterized protein (DUF362 family)
MPNHCGFSRRKLFAWSGITAGGFALARGVAPAQTNRAPASAVSVAKVDGYDADLVAQVEKMFDQIGGIGARVRGKTVAMKVNLTGTSGRGRRVGLSAGQTAWVHPNVVAALTAVFGKLGAKRIRILESSSRRDLSAPLEDAMLMDGWDISGIKSAAPNVEFEDTNWNGEGKQYSTLKVRASKPYIFPAFMLNHSYEDCDFFVSVAKMKNHSELALTLSMKNMFGTTPERLYGGDPNQQLAAGVSRSVRERVFHYGQVQAPAGVPQELDPKSNRYEGWRMPRLLTDICGARPIDLAVIDGIETIVGGEGAGSPGVKPVQPHLLVIGQNCVSTDAVAAATMGYNPRGSRWEAPFRLYKMGHARPDEQMNLPDGSHNYADNIMLMGEAAGLGSADLSKIDVRGAINTQDLMAAISDYTGLKSRGNLEAARKVIFDFEAAWKGEIKI